VSDATFLVVLSGPYIALAALGGVLFKRHRTLPTGLLALGFVTVVIGQLVDLYGSHEASNLLRSGGASAVAHSVLLGWIRRVGLWSGVAGMWLGSLSLVWHLLRPRGTSPNNRWSGP
jgi:hypothetical protein